MECLLKANSGCLKTSPRGSVLQRCSGQQVRPPARTPGRRSETEATRSPFSLEAQDSQWQARDRERSSPHSRVSQVCEACGTLSGQLHGCGHSKRRCNQLGHAGSPVHWDNSFSAFLAFEAVFSSWSFWRFESFALEATSARKQARACCFS